MHLARYRGFVSPVAWDARSASVRIRSWIRKNSAVAGFARIQPELGWTAFSPLNSCEFSYKRVTMNTKP